MLMIVKLFFYLSFSNLNNNRFFFKIKKGKGGKYNKEIFLVLRLSIKLFHQINNNLVVNKLIEFLIICVYKKLIKKKHLFHIGDTVSFTAGLSDRGDRMTASNIQYLYNTALDVLINKAGTENNFIGYLKVIDDKYFVKEIDSYLFFPVPLSPWQIRPTEAELNEAVTFSLENLDKKEKI